MTLASTVPGAITTLAGYMQTVAESLPNLGLAVYNGGVPTENVAANFLMVGNWPDGIVITPDTYKWAAIPGAAKLRTEEYAIQACIRCWAGDTDPIGRIGDAFTVLNSLHEQVIADIGGSETLSPSGSWGELHAAMEENGPIGGAGWGVVLGVDLYVINAQLSG